MEKVQKNKVKKRILIFVIILCTNLTIEAAEEKASYLIVKNPHAFTILNKYEQDITESEKNAFLAYSPLQILIKNTTLGDQLSKALKFQFKNQIYYLLRNDSGTLLGLKNTGHRQMLQNCIQINDTIRIVKDNVLRLSEQPSSKGRQLYLHKNDMLIRMFNYNNSYFLLRLGRTHQYGWSNLNPKSAWQKDRKQQQEFKSIVLGSSVRNRIASKIESVNEVYTSFFDYFNRIEGQSKSIPQWKISSQGNTIQISLQKNRSLMNQLTESTGILIKDLENILIGEPFFIKQQNDVISIEPEKK